MSERGDGGREAFIQREIELRLGAEPDLLLMKNSVGRAVFIGEETGKKYTVPYGLGVGSPDLVGVLRTELGLGVWIGLEVKVPGKDPEAHQAKCHRQWEAFGALVYVVHSAEEAVEALADARLVVRRAVARERRTG